MSNHNSSCPCIDRGQSLPPLRPVITPAILSAIWHELAARGWRGSIDDAARATGIQFTRDTNASAPPAAKTTEDMHHA